MQVASQYKSFIKTIRAGGNAPPAECTRLSMAHDPQGGVRLLTPTWPQDVLIATDWLQLRISWAELQPAAQALALYANNAEALYRAVACYAATDERPESIHFTLLLGLST